MRIESKVLGRRSANCGKDESARSTDEKRQRADREDKHHVTDPSY